MHKYDSQKSEAFSDATLEELQDIYDMVSVMPGWWLTALIDWADGINMYRPYGYDSGAQYIIGTLKGQLNQ